MGLCCAISLGSKHTTILQSWEHKHKTLIANTLCGNCTPFIVTTLYSRDSFVSWPCTLLPFYSSNWYPTMLDSSSAVIFPWYYSISTITHSKPHLNNTITCRYYISKCTTHYTVPCVMGVSGLGAILDRRRITSTSCRGSGVGWSSPIATFTYSMTILTSLKVGSSAGWFQAAVHSNLCQ